MTALAQLPAFLRHPIVLVSFSAFGNNPLSKAEPVVTACEVEMSSTSPGNRATIDLLREDAVDWRGAQVSIQMGYLGVGVWPVFTGYAVEDDGKTRGRVECQDDSALLEQTESGAVVKSGGKKELKKFARTHRVAWSAAEVVEFLLAEAGVEAHEVQLDTPRVISPYVMKRKTVREHLRDAAERFEIPYSYWFDADGVFHWHPPRWPAVPAALFEYGVNIVDIVAGGGTPFDAVPAPWQDETHVGEPTRLETLPEPALRPGMSVTVRDPALPGGVGDYYIEQARHVIGDSSRSYFELRPFTGGAV